MTSSLLELLIAAKNQSLKKFFFLHSKKTKFTAYPQCKILQEITFSAKKFTPCFACSSDLSLLVHLALTITQPQFKFKLRLSLAKNKNFTRLPEASRTFHVWRSLASAGAGYYWDSGGTVGRHASQWSGSELDDRCHLPCK